MKVAVLSQFFPPEPCAAANRIDALVRALVRAGYDVTVVTAFPSFPSGRLAPGDRFRAIRREERNGARVVRLLTMRFNGLPMARLAHWAVTALAQTWFLLTTRRRFDAVIVTVPPITLALPAIVARKRHRAKLIADVRDVFPDVAIAMGEWREGSLLARTAEVVVRALYRRAALISTVTPATVKQIAARGADPQRLLLAPNGADEPPANLVNGAAGTITAVYTGNLGLATDVDVIVDAAALLASDENVAIVVVGDGAQRARMQARIEAAGLRNITLTGALPRDDAFRMLARAKVSIVPLRAGIADSVPTKIFDSLCVGCPVIVCADGEAGAIAVQSEAGVALSAGDARGLADAIRAFAALDEDARASCGERGRRFVQHFYGRDAVMDGLCSRIGAL